MMKWLERRVIPKNRTFAEEILRSFGLSIGNTKGIIDVCKGLSLNDSYWIVPAMGINAVHYDLENWKGILASKCGLFIDIDTAFIPIGRIVKSGGISAVVKYYDDLGGKYADAVRDMLVFDALTYNEDRHFGNFSLLRDNRTGEIIGPAPVFDNGNSLFNLAMPGDYANMNEYANTRFPAYGNTTFEGICQAYMTARQTEKLRKMLGFTFTRHPKLNLPEEHVAAIEKHLQKRASRLIELSRAKGHAID